MPPKRGKPAKAAQSPPGTTSSRGKETSTTAASGRPRRAATIATPGPSTKIPNESSVVASKKRGRPAKQIAEEPPKKRSRGSNGKAAAQVDDDVDDDEAGEEVEEENVVEELAPTPKKRGRPASKAESAKPAPAVPAKQDPPPRKRGRPPKGGETTRISADDAAVADQLEEELLEAAQESVSVKSTRKRKAPATKKGKARAKLEEDVDDDADDELAAAPTSSGKQYWLMKAEQEDRTEVLKSGREFNTKFTIDDLRSKSVPEPWDGVRNAVAAKNMRAMKQGDLAFFYASGGKSGRKPGITGIMEIVKEHEPDETAWDEDAYGYVEKESDRNRWCVVHVEFRKKLSTPVSLKELQKYTQTNGVLAEMQVLNTTRLSVTAVSEKEWNFIVDKLIDGYDNDVKGAGGSGVEVRVAIPPSTNGKPTAEQSDEGPTESKDAAIPAGAVSGESGDAVTNVAKDPTNDTAE